MVFETPPAGPLTRSRRISRNHSGLWGCKGVFAGDYPAVYELEDIGSLRAAAEQHGIYEF